MEVNVAAGAVIGPRDVSVGGAVKPSALVVYDKIDGLKVNPAAGMARVGGNVFPKQLQQFEAVGINFGLDRSEERRVGKECRSRWSRYHEKKTKKTSRQ